jgi:fatty-acyl-CoA synthase
MNFELNTQKTLGEIFSDNASNLGEAVAITFIDEMGHYTDIRWRELANEGEKVASALTQSGVSPGDIVLISLNHSQKLIYSFWGAILGGMVPSILSPLTEKLDPDKYAEATTALINHSGATAIICEDQTIIKLIQKSAVPIQIIGPTIKDTADNAFVPPPARDLNSMALLQHSSGTTGHHKGVALSHQSVINQVNNYATAINLAPTDVIASWLPLYHDMGLIAGFVFPILLGIPLVLMSPFFWVRDPIQLFHAIDATKATLSWIPNFALNHMSRAISHKKMGETRLDSMRAFINCSEPIYHTSQRSFIDKFSQYGLSEKSLSTCYAMAENTFAITQHKIGVTPKIDWVSKSAIQNKKIATPLLADDDESISFVSNGKPIANTRVEIRNDDGSVLDERHVGSVFVQSDSMLREYHRRPQLTEQFIEQGWYNSGDLGYLADGELYISGREKDLIIVGGKNIYPHDLEAIANHTGGVIPGRAVAFGVYDQRLGSENIVMVCEITDDSQRTHTEIEMEIRTQISAQIEVSIKDIRFVGKKWVLKTSSGKIARLANKEKYLQQFR